jgi:hypothetical protein
MDRDARSRVFSQSRPELRHVLLLAPLIFVGHFLEEGTAFVDWFNSHVARGITADLFWTVNVTALVITMGVVVLEWLSRNEASAAVAVAWFSFLMLANALLHITGAIADGGYVPGLVTAAILYIPFGGWLMIRVVRDKRLPVAVVAGLAIAAAIPMLLHGYLIIFRGSRLF